MFTWMILGHYFSPKSKLGAWRHILMTVLKSKREWKHCPKLTMSSYSPVLLLVPPLSPGTFLSFRPRPCWAEQMSNSLPVELYPSLESVPGNLPRVHIIIASPRSHCWAYPQMSMAFHHCGTDHSSHKYSHQSTDNPSPEYQQNLKA